jgi:hypothetical protein
MHLHLNTGQGFRLEEGRVNGEILGLLSDLVRYFPVITLPRKVQTTTSAGEDVGKKEP